MQWWVNKRVLLVFPFFRILFFFMNKHTELLTMATCCERTYTTIWTKGYKLKLHYPHCSCGIYMSCKPIIPQQFFLLYFDKIEPNWLLKAKYYFHVLLKLSMFETKQNCILIIYYLICDIFLTAMNKLHQASVFS